MGCSNDDSPEDSKNETMIGNTYAHLLFETREDCQAARELYFTNCAQVLRIVNESQVEIYVTDILYLTNYYIEGNKLTVESTQDTH